MYLVWGLLPAPATRKEITHVAPWEATKWETALHVSALNPSHGLSPSKSAVWFFNCERKKKSGGLDNSTGLSHQ